VGCALRDSEWVWHFCLSDSVKLAKGLPAQMFRDKEQWVSLMFY
jgi:hypothetical protein